MERWKARRSVLGENFRNGHDTRSFSNFGRRQQPKRAGSRPLRMHPTVAILNLLERMRFQRTMNPLFYFTGHGVQYRASTGNMVPPRRLQTTAPPARTGFGGIRNAGTPVNTANA